MTFVDDPAPPAGDPADRWRRLGPLVEAELRRRNVAVIVTGWQPDTYPRSSTVDETDTSQYVRKAGTDRPLGQVRLKEDADRARVHHPEQIDQGGCCNCLVLRDGYGEVCGLPVDHPVHGSMSEPADRVGGVVAVQAALGQEFPVPPEGSMPEEYHPAQLLHLPGLVRGRRCYQPLIQRDGTSRVCNRPVTDPVHQTGPLTSWKTQVQEALQPLRTMMDDLRSAVPTGLPVPPEEITADEAMRRYSQPGEAFSDPTGDPVEGAETWPPGDSGSDLEIAQLRDRHAEDQATIQRLQRRLRGSSTTDSCDFEHQVNQLTQWWVESATADVAKVAPKAAEYGAADFVIMGSALLQMNPGAWAGADDHERQQVGQEQAIGFYLLGKVGRALSAWAEGRWPSDDTIDDLIIYSTMLRYVRSFGAWDLTRLG